MNQQFTYSSPQNMNNARATLSSSNSSRPSFNKYQNSNPNRGGKPINRGGFSSNNKTKRTNFNNSQQNLPSRTSNFEYDIPTISELLKKSEKNPIAL